MSDKKPWEESYSTGTGSANGALKEPWKLNYGPDAEKNAQPPARGFKGWGRDIAATAVKGAIGVPETLVGLADIPTGGAVGKFLENENGAVGFRSKQAKELVNDWHSDATKAAQQKFQNSDGFVDKAVTAIQNPSLIAIPVGESLPIMGLGSVAARGLMAAGARGVSAAAGGVGPSLPGALARTVGEKAAPIVAGGLGEGITMAGSAAEQIRQETPDGRLTPTQSGLALATGALGTAFGIGGGKLASRLGVGDVDTMIAQGSKGMAREFADDAAGAAAKAAANPLVDTAEHSALRSIPASIIKGAISEGFLEELPQSVAEQVLQNIALGKDWSKDVDAAAVMGVLSGGAMGGAAAGFHGYSRPEQTAAGATSAEPAKQASPLQLGFQPDPLVVFPDGTTGRRAEIEKYIASLPESQQIEARAKLMGYGTQRAAEPAKQASPGLDRVRQAYAAQLQALQDQEQGDPSVPQTTPPDGAAVLAQQRAQKQAEIDAVAAANRAVASPDDEIFQSTRADGQNPIPLQTQDYLAQVRQAVRSGTKFTTQDTVNAVRSAMEDAWLAKNVSNEPVAASSVAPVDAANNAGNDLQSEFDQAGNDMAIAANDARVRTGRILSGLQNIFDAGADNTIQAIVNLNRGLEKIGDSRLDKEEVARVRRMSDSYFGFRGATQAANLPGSGQRAMPDTYADNASLEGRIKERNPSEIMGLDPAKGSLTAGAAIAVNTGAAGQMQQAAAMAQAPAANQPQELDPQTQQSLRDELQASQDPKANTQAPDNAFAYTQEDPGQVPQNIDVQGAVQTKTTPTTPPAQNKVPAAPSSDATTGADQSWQPRNASADTAQAGAPALAVPTTKNPTANVTQAPEAQQSSPQQAQAGTAPATNEGLINAPTPSNNGTQEQSPAGAPAQAETPEQRAQRLASAGQTWDSATPDARKAIASRAPGLNTIQRNSIASKPWSDLFAGIKIIVADAMQPKSEPTSTPASTPAAPATQAQAAAVAPAANPQAAVTPAKTGKKPSVKIGLEAFRKARAEYFTPGNVLPSYGETFDRVVSYTPPDSKGDWSAEVQEVEPDGNGGYREKRGAPVRVHSTNPSERELNSGPKYRAPAPVEAVAQPDKSVPATQDGQTSLNEFIQKRFDNVRPADFQKVSRQINGMMERVEDALKNQDILIDWLEFESMPDESASSFTPFKVRNLNEDDDGNEALLTKEQSDLLSDLQSLDNIHTKVGYISDDGMDHVESAWQRGETKDKTAMRMLDEAESLAKGEFPISFKSDLMNGRNSDVPSKKSITETDQKYRLPAPAQPDQAAVPTGDAAVATSVASKQAAPEGKKASDHLGVNSQPISEGGKPFKTREDAGIAKKQQPMLRVVTVKGGFALAPKTEKQLAAEAKASKRLRQPNTSPAGEPISAHAFIAAEGGLNKSTRNDLGIGDNPRIGNRTLFAASGGLSIEQATEKLIAEQYLPEGASHNDAYALIRKSLTTPQYNSDGIERIAQAEQAARHDDYRAAQEDESKAGWLADLDAAGFTGDDAHTSGYDESSDPIKMEVNALLAQADALGIDTETIKEEAHEATRNGSEQDYFEAQRSQLQAAIRQGDGSRSNQADAGANPEQGREAAVNQGGADRGQDAGQQGSTEEPVLTSPTREEIEAKQDRADAEAKRNESQRLAAEVSSADDENRKRIAKLSEAASSTFTLGGDAMDNLTGQKSVFDAPAEPSEVAKAASQERFYAGNSLTKEQRKTVLKSLVDVYKTKGAPRESKGLDRNGNERSGYAYSPEYFEKSDITGAMVRYYVTMPDGKIAHPTELFPDYTQSDIDNEMSRRQTIAARLKDSVKWMVKEQFSTKKEAASFWNELSDKSIRGSSGMPSIFSALDRTFLTNGNKFVMVPYDAMSNGETVEALAEAGWTEPFTDNTSESSKEVKPAPGYTSADAKSAEDQLAQQLGEIIDKMTAGDVNKIAARYLPDVGLKATVSKVKNKAMLLDFTIANPFGVAAEFGFDLPDSIRGPLEAKYEGRLTDASELEQKARETKLFERLYQLAAEYERAVAHRERAIANGSKLGSSAFDWPYQGKTMTVDRVIELLKTSVQDDSKSPDYAKVSAMVSKTRPKIFKAVEGEAGKTGEAVVNDAAKPDPVNAKTESPKPVVSPDEFPLSEATRSYDGISQHGATRARSDRDQFVKVIQDEYDAAEKIAETPEQRAVLESEAQSLKEDYLSRYKQMMGVRSSAYSGFFVGRANLNVKQADKRNSALDKANDAFGKWLAANTGRIKSAVLSARNADQLAAVQAAKDAKAAEKERRDLELMGKLLAFKNGDDLRFGAAIVTRVSMDKDGYPNTVTVKDANGAALINNKISLSEIFGGKGLQSIQRGKQEIRRLVDLVRKSEIQAGKEISASSQNPDILFSRGKNDAMTNSNVVGNQGGRSADDNSPGGPGQTVSTGSKRFSEDNRLSNLSPQGASWQRIREKNTALRGKSPDDSVTIYRATIGSEIRPDDFVAVDKSTLRTELKNVRSRDGASAKVISKQVRVRDLLMGNDATEFVFFPEQIKSETGNNVGLGSQSPAMSRSPSSEVTQADMTQTVKEVEATVRSLTSGMENAPAVVVAFDMNDPAIPDAVRRADKKQRSGGATGTPEGFFHNGTVYLIASKLKTPDDVARVFAHEALGHYGLRGVFGDGLKPILQQIATMRKAEVDAKIKEYGLRGVNSVDRLTAAEEVLAELAQKTPTIGFVTRTIAAIRTWLRANVTGLSALRLSDAEIIRSYILPARGWVERGGYAMGGTVANASFSREDQTKTEAFKRWFGDSKVVDKNGRPLVVYHSSPIEDIDDFAESLSSGKSKKGSFSNIGLFLSRDSDIQDAYSSQSEDPHAVYVRGNLFTPSNEDTSEIADRFLRSSQGREMLGYDPVDEDEFDSLVEKLANEMDDGELVEIGELLESPDFVSWLYDEGYEGVDTGGNILVFDPKSQIKSATDNNGDFDPQNPDIRFSRSSIQGLKSSALDQINRRETVIAGETGRTYTPEIQAAMRNVGFMVERPSLKERAQALWQDAGKKMAQGIVDQFAPVKEISKDAYALLRLSKGSSGAFETLLKGGKLKLSDGVYDFDDANKGGVVDALLTPLNGEHHDFLRWVAANRAERLMGEDREHLFTNEDIAALKTLTDGDLSFDFTLKNGIRKGQTTRSRAEAYRDSLATFNAFNKNVMDMAEQSGLIDPESRATWESEFYVPFYRVADEESGGVRGMNIKGSVVRQQAFKHLKGGKQALNNDLLDNTLMNWAHLLDASAKNRAAKAALEAAAQVGAAIEAPKYTLDQIGSSIGKKNGVVWFMDEGKRRHFMVDDPYLLTAVSSLEYAGMNSPIMNALGSFKHALTIGVTASPFFKVRNLIRDSIQVIGAGPIGYNPAKNIAQGWKLTDPKADAYFKLLAGGGTIHFGTMLEGSESKRIQALVESGVDESTILNNDQKVKVFFRKFIEPGISAYNELGNRGEAVNRAALYDQLVKQGKSHAEASLMARDLMDFSMQGSFTTVRFLSQVVPFFNARLQGMYKLGRAAKEDPKRMAYVTGAVAMASLALMAGYGGDDDWKKREDWDRNNFWWFKFGDMAFRIPKPFEIGAIGTLAERSAEYLMDDEMTGKRFRDQVLALLGDNLSMNPIPQAVKPIMDVYANKDSFKGTPIENMGMERLKSEYRFNDRTSMTARATSTALNSVTGLVGKEALSPVQVDHLIRGYFGWLGTFAVSTADTIARTATSQPVQATPDYWRMATGGMVSDLRDAPSRYVSSMYDQSKALEQAYGTWHALRKSGKTEEAAQFLDENRKEITRYPGVQHIKTIEGKMNERIRQIEQSNMDPDAKREAIRSIRVQKESVAKNLAGAT